MWSGVTTQLVESMAEQEKRSEVLKKQIPVKHPYQNSRCSLTKSVVTTRKWNYVLDCFWPQNGQLVISAIFLRLNSVSEQYLKDTLGTEFYTLAYMLINMFCILQRMGNIVKLY